MHLCPTTDAEESKSLDFEQLQKRFSTTECRALNFYTATAPPDTDWQKALNGVDIVVHLAARAHIIQDITEDALFKFRRTNTQGTLVLARQAVQAGVQRIIFVSSICVNESVTAQMPFTPEVPPSPHSPYAQSKYEAEQGLLNLAAESGLEVVIIRPPLVYGPNAPGNFGMLLRWVQRIS